MFFVKILAALFGVFQKYWHPGVLLGLTCAGDGGRVWGRSVVTVLAFALPGSFSVVIAVGRTARALQVLRRRLVEAAAASWERDDREREKERERVTTSFTVEFVWKRGQCRTDPSLCSHLITAGVWINLALWHREYAWKTPSLLSLSLFPHTHKHTEQEAEQTLLRTDHIDPLQVYF